MTQMDRIGAIDNRMCREKLADSLIECLGVDGAIHACQENVWDGVLDLVLRHKHRARQRLGRNQRGVAPAQANRGLDFIGRRPYTVAHRAVR